MAESAPAPPLPTALRESLQQRLGKRFLTDPADCWSYGYDNSRQHALPQGVCLAHTERDVAAVLQTCSEHHVPVVTRGRGTGTTGAATPLRGGVVLSLENLRERLTIDPDNRLAIASTGFTNQELQDAAERHGFFWAPDPTSASVSTIGGNLAYNSAGPRAVKYGTPRENTLGLRAVSSRGEPFKTGVKTTKGVVGYDLTRLLIGSEGTLAVITEATLKLTPLAEEKRSLQALYEDTHAAANAVSRIMAQPIVPCALEFMDRAAIRLVRESAELDLPGHSAALLLIEVDGSASAIDDDTRRIADAAQGQGCIRVRSASNKEEVRQLWRVRTALSPALRNLAPKKINEDVVVPVSRMPELISGLEALSRQFEVPIVNFGHAGNGNLHVNLLIDPDNAEQARRATPCLDAVFNLVLSLDGSLSGEHGIGWAKRQFVDRELDALSLQLMRGIKQEFDPDNILNPGVGLPD